MTNRTDDFNRADSSTSLGSPSDGGSAWTTGGLLWGIASNAGYSASGATESWAWLESSESAVDVQVTITTGGTDAGLCARVSSQNNGLIVASRSTANDLKLYKVVSGSYTQLGSTYSGAVDAGDVLRLRCTSANELTVYQNGVARIGPVTDSYGSTNTKHGLRVFSDLSSRFDDFSITSLSAAAASLIYYQPAIAPLLVR